MRIRLLLSRLAVFVKCRLSLSYLHFLLSLYSDVPLFYRFSGMVPMVKSNGQGAFRYRAAAVMHNANSSSIIQGISHWELSERALGITAHQHQRYRMHSEWNGAFGNWCFERRLPADDSLSHFCVALINGTPEVFCNCIMV